VLAYWFEVASQMVQDCGILRGRIFFLGRSKYAGNPNLMA
jgi:hypothetical protein